MAFKRENIQYDFRPSAKAAMIMLLDQFGEDLETVHQIKEMLRVPGSVVLDSHYAVVLARLIEPHYPPFAKKLMRPLETYPTLRPNEHEIEYYELVDRLRD